MSVLVSYVPTEVGFLALGEGIKEASALNTKLIVLNVAAGDNFSKVTFADEKQLDDVRNRLAEESFPSEVRQLTGVADVADTVLDVAREEGAELIVVGLRRRTATSQLLLGSNAQAIILNAPCPVLSVRVTDR